MWSKPRASAPRAWGAHDGESRASYASIGAEFAGLARAQLYMTKVDSICW